MAGVPGYPSEVLKSQRAATRFQILTEVADNQPAVSQREIADVVGVTNQAVSEHLRGLEEIGHVRRLGRGRYEITKEGVDWLLSQLEALDAYLTHVSDEVLGSIEVETAIAAGAVEPGETVGLNMRDGQLYADPSMEDGARATAVTGGAPGDAIGVTDWEGVIDYDLGHVTIVVVPTVGMEPAGRIDYDRIDSVIADADLVAAAGTEAVAILAARDIDPDIAFGTPAAVQEAAARGLNVALICVASRVAEHTEPLRELEIDYQIVEQAD